MAELNPRIGEWFLKEVRKPLGKELWTAQEEEYDGKILIPKGNHHTSQHFHKEKKETIYCFRGEVDIILNDRVVTLKEGGDIPLVPRAVHRTLDRINQVLSKYQLRN